MIIQNAVKNIFMLCKLYEDTKIKCDQYWPKEVNEIMTINDDICNIELVLLSEDDVIINQIVKRRIKIKIKFNISIDSLVFSNISKELKSNLNEYHHEVNQYHIICWPDHSIPDNEISYNLFSKLFNIIDSNFLEVNSSPIVVHCSAGVGRTGSLISMYFCYDILQTQIRKNHINKENGTVLYINIFSIVRKLREQRSLFITDASQYKLIYSFVYQWIENVFLKR